MYETRAAVMMMAVTRDEIEMLMSTATAPTALTQNTFICVSCASCHMRNSTSGMFELKEHIQAITVGNRETMYNKFMGKFRGTIIQHDGKSTTIV